MHTAFINTAKKNIDNYADILEIQTETRQLLPFSCPLGSWLDGQKGYCQCAMQIGETIDSYKEVNNDYNLVIYVDLLEFNDYLKPLNAPDVRPEDREAAYRTLYYMFTHFFHQTLYSALEADGRPPHETVIIFEENQKKRRNYGDGVSLHAAIASRLLNMMGLPSAENLKTILAASRQEPGEDPGSFEKKILEKRNADPLFANFLSFYDAQVNRIFASIKSGTDVDRAVSDFKDEIMRMYESESYVLKSVSFETNRRAGVVNKRECAKRDLRLYFYLLECVYEGSVLIDSPDAPGHEVRQARPFPKMEGKWDTVICRLKAKERLFQQRHKEAVSLSDSYAAIKLAPELYEFDYERFGMDEFGAKGRELLVVDEDDGFGNQNKSKTGKGDPADGPEGAPIVAGNRKALIEAEKKASGLFTKDEYQPFDYLGREAVSKKRGAKISAKQYIEQAKALRTHHLNYLKKLKIHAKRVLSNYAGRSVENKPAILRKRKVSVAEEQFDDALTDHKYAVSESSIEKRELDTVEALSDAAYETAQIEYLKFCAGRSVAVTDIEEQCDWFITRIGQIEASLKTIKTVALGLLGAITALYIPFVVIQWEAITQSFLSVATALCSFAVPLILLYAVFTAVSIAQRRKFGEAWDEFQEKSDRSQEENRIAAERFDRLLSFYIPSLRWTYEFKLDVDFCRECCEMARAKIAHHIQKLHCRVETIGNILEDLECGEAKGSSVTVSNEEIDYNVSFCTGQTNVRFYSIVDREFLNELRESEEAN